MIKLLSFIVLLMSTEALAQTEKKTSVGLIYEAIARPCHPLLAEDARLFEKYGLDVKVIHARGAVPCKHW